jgi:hypothetical protein
MVQTVWRTPVAWADDAGAMSESRFDALQNDPEAVLVGR